MVRFNTNSDFLSSLQEACLQRLVEGLQTFTVLLKYVESEYPINRTLLVSETKYHTEDLIKLIKDEVGLMICIAYLSFLAKKQETKKIFDFVDVLVHDLSPKFVCMLLPLIWLTFSYGMTSGGNST